MTHIVRQHYLHVDLNGTEADGMALQNRLAELCHQRLIPAIERALDRCAPSDGHLIIERLDIDAGTLTLGQAEHDMAALVEQALEESLRAQSAEAVPTQLSGIGTRKTVQQAVHEAFIYFLKTGNLPWSFRLSAGKTLEQTLLDVWPTEPNADAKRHVESADLRAVLTSVTARQRLTRQFSPRLLRRLLARISPVDKTEIDPILTFLNDSRADPNAVFLFGRLLWETAFAHAAAGAEPTEKQLVRTTWRAMPALTVASGTLANELERYWPGVLKLGVHQAENVAPEPETDFQQSGNETELGGQLDVEDGLHVNNAGLVLLHPFLPRFFETLGIADEHQLSQANRALCLLHFLATGQPTAPEHELLLPKLLFNIPLETPVDADVALTEAEIDEATALLNAVISHWGALRGTSPDALRGTFLIRPGKLSLRSDGDWMLQVEPGAYDILLDQLPWSISMIKLPWMKRLLRVEWR